MSCYQPVELFLAIVTQFLDEKMNLSAFWWTISDVTRMSQDVLISALHRSKEKNQNK